MSVLHQCTNDKCHCYLYNDFHQWQYSSFHESLWILLFVNPKISLIWHVCDGTRCLSLHHSHCHWLPSLLWNLRCIINCCGTHRWSFSNSFHEPIILNTMLSSINLFLKVTCTTNGSGDVDITVSISPWYSGCTSLTPGTLYESCTMWLGNGTAYITVVAWAISEINLQCMTPGIYHTDQQCDSRPILCDSLWDNYFLCGYCDTIQPATIGYRTNGIDRDFDLYMSWNNPFSYSCLLQDLLSIERCSLPLGVVRAYTLPLGALSLVISCGTVS